MASEPMPHTLLSPYRILDLTDEKGLLCGKILADMGADVIKIEKPGGDPARRIGPFYRDDPHPEKSLYWFAFNTNKRGITLNLETTDGQELFKRLAVSADFVIESFPPGTMDRLSLGRRCLEKINPGLILVSITPFGQSGPYVEQQYQVTDMILWALGGVMSISGDPDRPPNQISFPHAYLHGGAEAAQGAMMALYARSVMGRGQHVDVSIQQCLPMCTMNTMQYWDMYKVNLPCGVYKRGMVRADGSSLYNPRLWPCKDGWVFLMVGGGALRPLVLSSEALVAWMSERGAAGGLEGCDWEAFDSTTITQEEIDRQRRVIEPFLMAHTMAELYEEAIKRKILLAPVNDPKGMAESPQLAARGFFVEIEHPELGVRLKYCGPWVQLSRTPLSAWKRAPLIGEHNREIYEQELGLSREQTITLKQAGII